MISVYSNVSSSIRLGITEIPFLYDCSASIFYVVLYVKRGTTSLFMQKASNSKLKRGFYYVVLYVNLCTAT